MSSHKEIRSALYAGYGVEDIEVTLGVPAIVTRGLIAKWREDGTVGTMFSDRAKYARARHGCT